MIITMEMLDELTGFLQMDKDIVYRACHSKSNLILDTTYRVWENPIPYAITT